MMVMMVVIVIIEAEGTACTQGCNKRDREQGGDDEFHDLGLP